MVNKHNYRLSILTAVLIALLALGTGSVFAQGQSIETRVWDDLNGNGQQDGNEASANLAGIIVELLSRDGNSVLDTTTTDASGIARFNVEADRYRLRYILPMNYDFAQTNRGNDASDSDPNRSNGRTPVIQVDAGQTVTDVDAGMWSTGRVEARVWNDLNENGQQDANEANANVAGVTVELLDRSNGDAVIGSAVTNSNGIAIIDGVPADRQSRLRFIAPDGTVLTFPNRGNDATDSDPNRGTGLTRNLPQPNGGAQVYVNHDAGLIFDDVVPSETPTEPSETPTEPSETPTEPSETPTEPSETPTEPSETPTEPSETPTEPSETPTEPTETPTEPSGPVEPQDLDLCWLRNPSGSTQWRIINPNPVPLGTNPEMKMRYNWATYDQPSAQGNIIQSAQGWDNPGEVLVNTSRAVSFRLEWYLERGGMAGPILGVIVGTASDVSRCDLPRVNLDTDGSAGNAPNFVTTYTEDQAPIVIQDDVSVRTPGNAAVSSATVTITNLLDGADEVLAANAGGTGLSVSYANGVLSISGNGSAADYQTVLDSLTYVNNSQDPNETQRAIEVIVTSNGKQNVGVFAYVGVVAVNDAPVAVNDNASVDEDSFVSIPVLANDTDVEGDTLSVTQIMSGPSNGTAVIEADGTITYTPNANFNGADAFVYEISDGNGGTATAMVSITVNPVNDAPVAADDSASTDEDTPVNIPVLDNDTDIDGDSLSVSQIVSTPSNGNVVIEADGTITYTPAADFNGQDSFQYEVSDGNGGTDTATVTITINAVNDAPVAVDDSATTNEDTSVNIPVLDNDTDVENDTLTVTAAYDPTDGSVVVEADGTVTYTPSLNFNGVMTFKYDISDGNGGTDTATVTVTVNPVNDAPNAEDDNASTDEDTSVNIPVLGNDFDIDGDSLSVSVDIANLPQAGGVVVEANNSITYTPNANFNGSDSFVYTLSDGNGGTDTATVTITVNPINDAPVASDDNASVDEDSSVNIPVLANDTDSENDALTVTTTSNGPSNGNVVIEADNTITYTPNADFNGSDSFEYTISDGNGGSDTATVTITGNPINDAPVASDDNANTDENVPVNIPVLDNDSDIDGDTLNVSQITSNPSNGQVVIEADNTITYTPNVNFDGSDSFEYEVSDGNGGTDTATVTVSVANVNDAPEAVDDNVSTNEDMALNIVVLVNDSDANGDTLSVTGTSNGPSNGNVVIEADNTITYTPNVNFNGSDSFDYTISDGNGGTDTATVTITVNLVNDAPIANDDSFSVDEDSVLNGNVKLNDIDIENHATALLQSDVSNGVLVLNGDGSFTYTPDANFSGQDSFAYVLRDPDYPTTPQDSATVTITVSNINDAPVAVDDNVSVDEDSFVNIVVLINDSDADGDSLNVTGTSNGPNNGQVVIEADNSITYTPDPNFFGIDTFDYEVSDGNGTSTTATVTVTVNPVNDAPVAGDDNVTTDEDTPVNIVVLTNDNDVDGDTITIFATSNGPTNGQVVIENDGTITYTPDANFNGQDTFGYEITDGNGGLDIGMVTVTVNPVNDAPVANDDTANTIENTLVNIAVLDNDNDVENDTLSISQITTQPNNGTAVINGMTIDYTPNNGFIGQDTFVYEISDGNGGTDTATVTVTVNSANTAPVAVDDTANTSDIAAVNINVLVNDSDADNDTLTVTQVTQPANGSVVIEADNTITYTPNGAYVGDDTFTYTISDSNGGTATATVTVTVASSDTPPQVSSTSPTSNANNQASDVTVTINFNEPVDIAADGIVLECGSAVQFLNPISFTTNTPLPVTNVTSFTFDPVNNSPFLPGALCEVTVDDDKVTDSDSNDGPDKLDGDANGTEGGDYTFLFELKPEANAFSYPVTGNVTLDSNTRSTNRSVIDNDLSVQGALVFVLDSNGDPVAFNNGFAQTTTQCGGLVTFSTTGKFVYVPPAGYEGADSFQYRMDVAGSDNLGSSATATITLNISDVIWFIDNSQGTNGDGTLANPFNNLQSFVDANGGSSTAAGSGCGNDVTDPEAGDNIFIYGTNTDYTSTGLVLLDNQTLIGQGTNDGSLAQLANLGAGLTPAVGSIDLPATNGTNPNINTTGDDVVMLGNTNNVRGLDLEINASGEIGLQGNTFGTALLSDINIRDDAGGANSQGQLLALHNGTLSGASNMGTLQTSGGVRGIQMSSVSGSLSIGTTSMSGITADGIDISNGSVSINFGNTTVTSTGDAVVFDNTTGNMTLANTGGFTSNGGDALVATTHSGQINITNNGGGLVAADSCANIFGDSVVTMINIAVQSCTTNNSLNHGIRLEDVAGTGFKIENATQIDMSLSATVASIIIQDSTATLIDLSDGSTLNIVERSNSGIVLNNVSSAINIGAATISNTTNQTLPAVALNAVTGAVDFDSVSINQANRGAGETFPSSFPADNSGSGDAIYANGASGGLTINGGTISNVKDDAIDWRNSGDLVLNSVNINHINGNTGTAGIQSYNSTGIAMTGGEIINFGSGSVGGQRALAVNILHDSGFTTATGTFTFDSVDFNGGTGRSRGGAIAQYMEDNAETTLNVINGSTFTNVFGKAIITQNASGAAGSTSGGTTVTNITGNTFNAPYANGQTSVEVQSGGAGMSGNVEFTINNNSFNNFGNGEGTAIFINLNQGGNARTQTNTINDNTITDADAANGIGVVMDETSGLRLVANNNVVNSTANVAFFAQGLAGWTSGEADISMTNNDFFSTSGFAGATITQDGGANTHMRVYWDDVDITVNNAFPFNALEIYSRTAGRLDFVSISGDYVAGAFAVETIYAQAGSNAGGAVGIMCLDFNDDGGGANTADEGFTFKKLGGGQLIVENGTTGAAVIGDNPGMNTGFSTSVTGATQGECFDANP